MTSETNIQVFSRNLWIVEEVDAINNRKTLHYCDSLETAKAKAAEYMGVGHELHECHDCGVWVDPEGDRNGCGCHCPNCNATL